MSTDEYPGAPARAVIQQRWPALSRHLADSESFSDIELDAAGPVQTLRAGGCRLASAWNPDSEAQLQIAHLPLECESITLFGVGMAYLPELLLHRLAPKGRLEVVLMNSSLFAAMLDIIDQSRWLAHPALSLSLARDHQQNEQPYAVTTPLLTLAEPSAWPCRDRLWQDLSCDHTVHFQRKQNQRMRTNIVANEAVVAADADVGTRITQACQNASADTRCVVVGAGPSLDHALPRIRQLQHEGSCVVSVDAALIPLVRARVAPDYVVSLDPQAGVMRFYETDLSTLSECSLVYFPSVQPDVIHHWPWTRHVAYTLSPCFDELRARLPRASLFSSGSVIHPAMDLAVRLGHRKIYLAGADFCFPFGATHATGSVVNRPAAPLMAGGPCTTDYRGTSVASAMNLISYYRDLEAYIQQCREHGRTFVNLGPYSARLAGVSFEAIAA